MDLSIILVNWNSSAYLEKCIDSISKETKGVDYEIIVVDNGSFDIVVERIKSLFTKVFFVQSDENLGFARANNLGYQYSSGENLLFLNPDTEVVGKAISILLWRLNSLPDGGAIGCRLVNSDMSIQASCIQRYPRVLNQLLDIEYLRRLTSNAKIWGTKPLFQNDGRVSEVEVISGACLMVKRKIFERVGLFSNDYFMYCEDVDLCYKIENAGYKKYYTPEATVVHYGGGSTTKIDNRWHYDVLKRESILRFFRKTRGEVPSVFYRGSMMVASASRLPLIKLPLLLTVLFKSDGLKNKVLLARLYKWKGILRWSLGFEKWVKELNQKKSSEERVAPLKKRKP